MFAIFVTLLMFFAHESPLSAYLPSNFFEVSVSIKVELCEEDSQQSVKTSNKK